MVDGKGGKEGLEDAPPSFPNGIYRLAIADLGILQSLLAKVYRKS
jgi:hypothetical protein